MNQELHNSILNMLSKPIVKPKKLTFKQIFETKKKTYNNKVKKETNNRKTK